MARARFALTSKTTARATATAIAAAMLLGGCASDADVLTIYSGRDEALVQPLIDEFSAETGLEVEVRYASTAEMAAQILEEGVNTPADVYLSQDAGALGALSKANVLRVLPSDLLDLVDPGFRAANGEWIGVTGRARVLVYNPEMVETLPSSVLDLVGAQWKGRIGIAPGNASFQSFVTALRVLEGEQVAADWLAGIKLNAVIYEKNGAILEAVESGQLAAGLINHYYWYSLAAEKGEGAMNSALATFESADSGNLINVSGVGVIGDNPAALLFAEFLLSETSQKYFAEQESEFPLRLGLQLTGEFVSLADWPAPKVDLSDLDTLEQTLELIRAAGLL